MTEHICLRCGQAFAAHRGTNRYCQPCGPVARQEGRALYRQEHREQSRLYEAIYRAKNQKAKLAERLLRCWCGSLFVPRRSDRAYCTVLCGQRYRRAKLRASRGIVVVPAAALTPVDHDLILTQIMETARRARARIDAERELAGTGVYDRQERLTMMLRGIRNPFAVP